MTDLAGRIRERLGAELAVAGEAARAAFAVDGLRPAAVAYPEAPEQVAALLALAAEEGWTVLPWGGGSGLGRGNAPARYDLALSLSRLATVYDHDAENLTLTAAAGLSVAEANRHLAARHQMLAIAHADSPRTLGGAVAANALAPKRLLYGEVRDQLLGLRVALPDGSLVRYGRKVLKNVAGYDMNKLFLGSQGLLGVVVEATCKLFAVPDEERTLLAPFADADAAVACAAALYGSPLLPAFVLLLDAPAAAQARAALGHPPTAGALHLLLGFEGRPATLQRQLGEARALLAGHEAATGSTDAGSAATVEAAGVPPALREVLEAHGPAPGQPADVRLRLGVVPTTLAGTRRRVVSALTELGLAHAIVMDYAAGQLHVALQAPEPEALPALAGCIGVLRHELAPQRGYLTLEAAPPALKQDVDALGAGPGELHLMRRLKQRFDPHDVLAPGRYLGTASPAGA